MSSKELPSPPADRDDGADGGILVDLAGATTAAGPSSRSRSDSIDSQHSMGSKSVESTDRLWHLENELERAMLDETPIGGDTTAIGMSGGGADGGGAGVGAGEEGDVTARTSRWAAAAREESDAVSNRRAGRREARAAMIAAATARKQQEEEEEAAARKAAASEILRSGGSGTGGGEVGAGAVEEASVTSSATGVTLGRRRSTNRDRSKTILAQLEAAALGGGQQGIAAGGGGAGGTTSSRRNLLAGSLRQLERSRSLYSTASHGPDDSDDESLEEGIGPLGGTGPRLLGAKSQVHRDISSSSSFRRHSSIENLQSDLHASTPIRFSGLKNMDNLEDLDASDLDRIHNRRASLELHELAEGRTGASPTQVDPAPQGLLQVRERANKLGLADDNVPLTRAHGTGSLPEPKPSSSSSSSSYPQKGEFGAKVAGFARAVGRAGATVKRKIRGDGDADDIHANDNHNRPYSDTNDDWSSQASIFEGEYSQGRQRSHLSEELDIAPTQSRVKRPKVVLAMTVCVAAFIAFVCNAFGSSGSPPAAISGHAQGNDEIITSIGVPSPHGDDEEARVGAIKQRIRDAGLFGDIDCRTDPPSPECRAVRWLALVDPMEVEPDDEYILQRYALAIFWYSTFGLAEQQDAAAEEHFWTEHDGWMTGSGICSWFGIICHPQPGTDPNDNIRTYADNNQVTHIRLPENNIKGTIPRETFHLLTEMRQIDLSENSVSGSIPSEIGKMTMLKYAYLYNNVMTGSVPSEIGSCIDMREIDFSDNNLSGSIPSSIGQLRSLSLLSMYGNSLTGRIPNEVGNLGLVGVLYLDNNKLGGTIPDGLFNLPKLYDLRMNKNELSGTIPESTGDLALELLYLDSNQLEGFIPKSLSRHDRLASLRLHSNKLIGQLPSELGNLKSLDHLSLEYNSFESTIPPEWAGLTHLSELFIQGNRITGVIPTYLGVLSDLKEFVAHDNLISGTIPTELGKLYRLEKLALQNNKLRGTLPSEIAELENLKHLTIGGNVITGVVHNEICELTKVSLREFSADCEGKSPDIVCSCCTVCL